MHDLGFQITEKNKFFIKSLRPANDNIRECNSSLFASNVSNWFVEQHYVDAFFY